MLLQLRNVLELVRIPMSKRNVVNEQDRFKDIALVEARMLSHYCSRTYTSAAHDDVISFFFQNF